MYQIYKCLLNSDCEHDPSGQTYYFIVKKLDFGGKQYIILNSKYRPTNRINLRLRHTILHVRSI